MAAEEWDTLVRELKSLRQKRGLSLQALAKCPGVLAALNNPPLQEASDQLCRLVEQLGTDERAVALRTAYAIDMKDPRMLMARRSDLHEATGRDLKTLARYEDQMIEEVASRILGTTKASVSDSQIYVVGYLKNDHLARVTVTIRFPSATDEDVFERTVEYVNHSKNHSMLALIYQLPHDWEPQSLILAVVVGGEEPRLRFWAAPASELLDLMFATHGEELPVTDGGASVQIDNPKRGSIHTIYWASRASK